MRGRSRTCPGRGWLDGAIEAPRGAGAMLAPVEAGRCGVRFPGDVLRLSIAIPGNGGVFCLASATLRM